MMLLVDAGNTRVKWAVVDADAALGTWQIHGAVPHAQLSELAAAWAAAGGVTHALVSNVAGAQLAAGIAAVLPEGIAVEWFASTLARAGLRNGYREPGRLGCDRFAAFAARWNLRHAWQGETVVLLDHGAVRHEGRAAGVDDSGRLLLDTSEGRITVMAGDVSLRVKT